MRKEEPAMWAVSINEMQRLLRWLHEEVAEIREEALELEEEEVHEVVESVRVQVGVSPKCSNDLFLLFTFG